MSEPNLGRRARRTIFIKTALRSGPLVWARMAVPAQFDTTLIVMQLLQRPLVANGLF